jgi:hypothetical protein
LGGVACVPASGVVKTDWDRNAWSVKTAPARKNKIVSRFIMDSELLFKKLKPMVVAWHAP